MASLSQPTHRHPEVSSIEAVRTASASHSSPGPSEATPGAPVPETRRQPLDPGRQWPGAPGGPAHLGPILQGPWPVPFFVHLNK